MNAPQIVSALGHARLLSAGSAVDVDLNPALFLIQFGIITGLLVVLKPMLFDPLIALFEEREKRIDGARAEARRMDDAAADILRKYDGEIQKVHRAAAEERDRLRAEAQSVEAKEMGEAKAESNAILDTGRKKLAAEAAELETKLKIVEKDLARDIASRVLGREVS
jgi:F-type H+-transporting ATPase subunit b